MGPAFQTGANVACESQGFSVETKESHFQYDFWGAGDVISEILENTWQNGRNTRFGWIYEGNRLVFNVTDLFCWPEPKPHWEGFRVSMVSSLMYAHLRWSLRGRQELNDTLVHSNFYVLGLYPYPIYNRTSAKMYLSKASVLCHPPPFSAFNNVPLTVHEKLRLQFLQRSKAQILFPNGGWRLQDLTMFQRCETCVHPP